MKETRKEKVLTIVGIITILIFGIGATYAYFTAQGGNDAKVNMNVTTHTTDSLVFEVGSPISIYADQSNFADGMPNQEGTTFARATAKAGSNTEKFSGKYNIFFVIDENDFEYTTSNSTAELIMTVKDPTGTEVTSIPNLTHTTVKGVSGFDITTKKGTFAIAKEYVIEALTSNTKIDEWEITVTLVNLDSNQNGNTKKTFRGQLFVTKENMESYALPIVNTIETTTTGTELTVKAKVGASTAEVVNYYYGIEESSGVTPLKVKRLATTTKAATYEKSESDTHTFTGLTTGKEYKVSIYTEDANGFKSPTYENIVSTDNYTLPTITSVEASVGATNIDLTVNATQGNNSISKYFYKVEGVDTTFIESTSNKKSYTGLITGETYTITIYVQDINGRNSYSYTMKVMPNSYHEACDDSSLACTIAKKYTDGSNGIYYHNGFLENDADDNSYRFVGGNYIISNLHKTEFNSVNNTSSTANGIIGFNCRNYDSYVESYCSGVSYYYLTYDNQKIQYSDYNDAISKAIEDGYIEELKNWVCFGTDAEDCDDEHLYRIIGIFNEHNVNNGIIEQRIKLIKNSISTKEVLTTAGDYYMSGNDYSWNKVNAAIAKDETGFQNVWSYSALNKLNLNNNFLNSFEDKWQNMISESIWYVGGFNQEIGYSTNAKTVYQNEIGNLKVTSYPFEPYYKNNEQTAKVGLIYLSDYYYAALPEYWNYRGYSGVNDTTPSYKLSIKDNWMYINDSFWTISRKSDSINLAFAVSHTGASDYAYVNGNGRRVRPTFYLNSDVTFTGGTGTSTDPYRIA